MNFPSGLIGAGWSWVAAALYAALLLHTTLNAPWGRLARSSAQNVWLGAVVLLAALWHMKAGVRPGLNFHLVGATVLTLMFGPRLALVALSLVLAVVTSVGDAGWSAFGLNGLLMTVVPVLVCHAVFRCAERWLPQQFFVYIFLDAFFGAALTVLAIGFVATGLLAALGIYATPYLLQEYLPFFLLLAWSEAFLSGLLMTIFVVYRPEWVGSFDDRRYLDPN